jgi:hypothetical protein
MDHSDVGHAHANVQIRFLTRHIQPGFAATLFVPLPIQSYRSILLSSRPRQTLSILGDARATNAYAAAAAATLPLLSGALQGMESAAAPKSTGSLVDERYGRLPERDAYWS